MSLSGEARAQLIERSRQELPHPGDPRLLMADLSTAQLGSNEALEILSRTSLAWMQLRDMGLERSWQSGFGWFMARNLMVYGVVALALVVGLGPPPAVLDGALAGAALYYLIVMAMSPLRVRQHKHRREGILRAYAADLDEYLDGL
ncbi:MAG: Flp pilus assembly protein TadB [Pseudohongiellaceae bacterium]